MARIDPTKLRGTTVTPDLPALYDKLTTRQRQLAREEYIERQGGMCYACKMPLDGPPSQQVDEAPLEYRRFPGGEAFLRNPIHLHHCHRTGLTIGAVHAKCNAYLWQYLRE